MMHRILPVIAAIVLSGCNHKPASVSVSDAPLIEPNVFALWPSVTAEPVDVGPGPWRLCRGPTPEQELARREEEEANGPHAGYSIVVRVIPSSRVPFEQGKTLPQGSIVVKEKYLIHDDSRSLEAYAFMIKREAGYDAANGNWEYAYITIRPESSVTRGRLAECSQCHAKASGSDYLFRLYLRDSK